ncbi:LytTR family DNA-binding domain-containing protein [Dyadobacter sp. CY326]|uniref:LytR/AlgR family response regulator transcription factor n=1 Tax=Dyadobacter sp. CY326 TaxID=2907300 RepID=UPI001F1B681B|nr:LytTR family DNA-binding domain-containing protein [Dyadobacter sp. CY326]MCE7065102.1 LytTR family DNA-binding domain-containing protein [Dyadobacter sp. CY326]
MNLQKKTFTAIIADDNRLDRLLLESLVRKYPFIEIAGVFASAIDAQAFMSGKPLPDILILDIDMPGMSGLTLREQLPEITACIFVTSHPEFALEGFELAALDYVVKPLKQERFAITMERLELFLTLHYKAELLDYTLGGDTLFIKDGTHTIKVKLHDIIYLEALKDYSAIITRQRKYCVSTPLGNLLKKKGFESFVRIHRSYAIQKHYIHEVSAKGVKVNDVLLPVGRTYKDDLRKLTA